MHWLLLIHHIPPKPGYLRAKAAKRLGALGAVALKNAVYCLPDAGTAREDLSWLAKEIEDGGGKAFVCRAELLAGLDDGRVKGLFLAARDADYDGLTGAARELLARARDGEDVAAELARLKRDALTVRQIDFFGAPGRDALDGLLAAVDAALSAGSRNAEEPENLGRFQGRTWVTRTDVHVDRMASAWLIRRFIDPAARFRFVAEEEEPRSDEVRFDMLTGEFTHQAERCTFEMLLTRFGFTDPALAAVAEVVHDLDLREERHGRPETPGVGALLSAISMAEADDARRLERAAIILDDLLAYYRLGR